MFMKRRILLFLSSFALLSSVSLTSCGYQINESLDRRPDNPIIYSHPEVLSPIFDEENDPSHSSPLYPILKKEYNHKISLKVMGACNAGIDTDWSSNKFFKRMSEEMGVDFTFNVYGDDSYPEKKSLVLSTGSKASMPDILIKASLSASDELSYGGKSLIPLNDSRNNLLEKYAPNITKILKENPIIKESITAPNGSIYALPCAYLNLPNNTTTIMRGFFWINKSWMGENVNLPKTTDEFYSILESFDQNHRSTDNSYPLVISGTEQLIKLFNIFGLEMTNYWVQVEKDENGNDKLVFGPTDERFEKAIRFFWELLNKNYMNRDWSTREEAATMAEGTSRNNPADFGCFVTSSPDYVVGNGKYKQYVTLDPISDDEDIPGFWAATNPVQKGCFAITYACEYPELAIRFIDSLYDINQPYAKWASIGKENYEWAYNDDDETATNRKWHSMVPDSAYSKVMAKTIIQTGDGMPCAVDETFWGNQSTSKDRYIRPLRNRQMQFGYVGLPDIYIKKSEAAIFSMYAGDIDITIRRFLGKVLSGSSPRPTNADFIEFRENINRMLEKEIKPNYCYMDLLTTSYKDFIDRVNKDKEELK